jgi:hypothetical protein
MIDSQQDPMAVLVPITFALDFPVGHLQGETSLGLTEGFLQLYQCWTISQM